MKVLFTSVGTRGDMEPFLAIAEIVRERGHEVVCAFPEQFRDLAESSGMRFESLGREFLDLLDSPAGKAAMGGAATGMQKFRAYARLARLSTGVNKALVRAQKEIVDREQPDRIVHNAKAVYPVIWSALGGGYALLVSPVPYLHYVKSHAHIGLNGDYGAFINGLTYRLADFGLVTTIMMAARWLGLRGKVTRRAVRSALDTKDVIYTISPTLFPRPEYWPPYRQVLGYHERSPDPNWIPGETLADFLERHNKILLVTFGSMTNPEPEEKTRIFLDILRAHGIPAIFVTGAGGLVAPAEYDAEHIHFIERIPYQLILPRVYGMVHHGGSGTTHMAFKYGCATMAVPHIIDQFVWGDLVADLGAGPKGIPIAKLTRQALEPRLLDLWENPAYKAKARALAEQMQAEDFREMLGDSILS